MQSDQARVAALAEEALALFRAHGIIQEAIDLGLLDPPFFSLVDPALLARVEQLCYATQQGYALFAVLQGSYEHHREHEEYLEPVLARLRQHTNMKSAGW